MATERSVKVRLTAEAKSLIGELKSAASAAEELKTSTTSVDRELKDLQNRADRAGTSLLRLAADGKVAGEGLKSADKQLAELNRDLDKMGSAGGRGGGATGQITALKNEITATEAEMSKLRLEFQRTGSASSLSGFLAAEKELGKLRSLLKDVERIGGGGKQQSSLFNIGAISGLAGLPDKLLGANFSGKLDQQLAKGFEMSLTNPYVLGVIAAAAPAVGVVIGAGVLTGIGLAGIGAGIAGQLSSLQVHKALSQLDVEVSNTFREATSSFEKPLTDAIRGISAEFIKLGPGMRHTFDALAPSLAQLGAGVAGFIDKLAPGLERAAVASKPLIEGLSNWLPRLGGELGGLFETIASHEAEANAGLNMLTKSLDLFLTTASTGITVTSWLFDAMKLTGLGVGYLSAGEDAKKGADGATAFQQALQDSLPPINGVTDGLADLNRQLEDTFGQMMSVDEANLQLKEDMLGLADSVKQNGRSLDDSTKAGQANEAQILRLIQDAEAQRVAVIAAGDGTQEATDTANAAYKSQIGQIEALAIKLGLPISQVQDLIDKYKQLQHAPNIYKSVNITIRENVNDGSYYQTPYGKALLPNARGGILKFAAGGVAGLAGVYPPSGAGLIQFAEQVTDGETLIPNRGISAARGLSLADYAARNYGGRVTTSGGGGTITVNVVVTDDTGRMLRTIRKEVDRSGGGNVQLALGKSGR